MAGFGTSISLFGKVAFALRSKSDIRVSRVSPGDSLGGGFVIGSNEDFLPELQFLVREAFTCAKQGCLSHEWKIYKYS
jgi:hypothetical protein